MTLSNLPLTFAVSALIVLVTGFPAHAYVGPALGLGLLSVIWALISGVVLVIVGLAFFPIRRLLKKRKAAKQAQFPAAEDE